MSVLSIAASGIDAATRRFEQASSRIARAGSSTGLASETDTDLTDDIVDQLAARQSFTANVAVARTGDQVLGTLLDIIA